MQLEGLWRSNTVVYAAEFHLTGGEMCAGTLWRFRLCWCDCNAAGFMICPLLLLWHWTGWLTTDRAQGCSLCVQLDPVWFHLHKQCMLPGNQTVQLPYHARGRNAPTPKLDAEFFFLLTRESSACSLTSLEVFKSQTGAHTQRLEDNQDTRQNP